MCGRTQSATVKVTVASLSQYYAGWTGPLYLPVHARPDGGARLLHRILLVLDRLDLALHPALDPPRGRGGVRVGRMPFKIQIKNMQMIQWVRGVVAISNCLLDAFLEEG